MKFKALFVGLDGFEKRMEVELTGRNTYPHVVELPGRGYPIAAYAVMAGPVAMAEAHKPRRFELKEYPCRFPTDASPCVYQEVGPDELDGLRDRVMAMKLQLAKLGITEARRP